MRAPTALGLAVLLVLSTVGAASAVDLDALRAPQRSAAIHLDLGAADAEVITSDNVTYLGTIPIDSPGVGGEPVEHANGRRYFYATGLKGLSIYDVTDPALPMLAGQLALPHSQNEDLKVSEDGTRAVISADGSLLVGIMPLTRGIHIIDTTDPANPKVVGSTSSLVAGTGNGAGRAEHTSACADPACEWIYGSSSGNIYDATDPSDIKVVDKRWNVWELPDADGNVVETAVGGRHALNRDASGLLISDSNPRLVLDVTGAFGDGTGTFAEPELLAVGPRDQQADNRLQHNNVRPDSELWEPRDPDDPADDIEMVAVDRSGAASNTVPVMGFAAERPALRPGELLIGNSESNLNTGCSSAGGLSTWSMIDFEKGAPMQQLEVFRPLNGSWVDGSPARNALGCSGHWFTESDGIVAASWYEHGVRFFDVDKTTGTIDQVGFFQPVATEAGAAYWIDDEHVYSMDYARGLDILRFDRDPDLVPDQETFDRSWLANLGRVGALAEAERLWCRLGTTG